MDLTSVKHSLYAQLSVQHYVPGFLCTSHVTLWQVGIDVSILQMGNLRHRVK